ncbi:copper chaperone PCu(A)C [Actinacidiphila epipremni]|uniref:Copper chaperone PCu(A)C n=1 Tax=Actinacidiphila epipremni TaxID=2053013 RepID=A0ABX0ZUV3_9ACTN|nr:copper chaperone PCu(A)C [Actinacidiphila epipremni]NJP46346.1 copper chaperone PCu(A)C [Actinacidiphila epipremni]
MTHDNRAAEPVAPKNPQRRPAGPWRGALAPLAVVAVALFSLTLYASSGAAGALPARIRVTAGQVLAPTGSETTSAYFDLANTGQSADTLLSVSSPRFGRVMMAHTVQEHGAGRMEPVRALALPPGSRLAMSPFGTDLMLPADPSQTPGSTVDFDLHFAGSGTIRARAVVVPLGG